MGKPIFTQEALQQLCASLSYLLGAGLSPGDALLVLHQDAQPGPGKDVLGKMAQGADSGVPLARLMGEEGFPPFLQGMVEAGERVGKLEPTLAALGRYYGSRAEMSRRLRTALGYPAALLGVLLAVVLGLLIWVLPIFDDVYAQLGTGLSGFSGLLLALGSGLGKALPWICGVLALGGCLAAIPGVRAWAVSLGKRFWGDKGVLGQVNSARFLQAVSLGVECGMADKEALTLARGLVRERDPAFAQRCRRCEEMVEAGDALHTALHQAGFLTHSDHSLLCAAWRSGHGAQAFSAVARQALERSEEDFEQKLGRLEPAMVAVACGIVAGVLISVMVPLLHIMNSLG